jgi:glucose-6-phosphate isomerase
MLAEAAWQALTHHRVAIARTHLRELFANDPNRAERFHCEAAGFYLDFSKNRISEETLDLLVGLARAYDVRRSIDAMFAGEKLNTSEGRAVLHVALRAPADASIRLDGRDVVPEVQETLARMERFAEAVRSGAWKGHTGKRIRNVVNLGIGGSDLGPRMVAHALQAYADPELRVRFVANVDATDFALATRDCDPAETLFIVCSKTFTTQETLANARTAREWSLAKLRDDASVARHFVAVSTNLSAVAEFGIDPGNAFPLWDWVGGRFSFDSAVGLASLCAIGPTHFRALLAGARAMDEHFRTASFHRNLPVLLALIGIWNADLLGADSLAVLPYSEYLSLFPAWLQQLDMESNGKSVTRDGKPVSHGTAPIVWGQPGTNGQHAFHQLLHQGTRLVACDFIGFAEGAHPLGSHQEMLLSNLVAQSQALAFGKTPEEVRAEGVAEALVTQRSFDGNRPSNTLLAQRLDPHTLGALCALYEHKIAVQGWLWELNSFDQWGVELGKQLANRVLPALSGDAAPSASLDGSTRALIAKLRALRAKG